MQSFFMEENKEVEQLKYIIKSVFFVDINRETRKRDFVDARRVYSKILRERGYSFADIGRTIKKNHATIIHYLRDIDHIFVHDKSFFEKYSKCREAVFNSLDDNSEYESDIMYKQIIKSLETKLSEMTYKCIKISKKIEKYNRIKSIIELIEERTCEGDEEIIEGKIRKIFNGFKRE